MAASFDLVNTVQRRLRDVGKFAYPDATVVRMLDHIQRAIQAAEHPITATAIMPTQPGVTLYRLPGLALPAGTTRIVRVEAEGRTLARVPWHSLVHQNPGWLRKVGRRIEVYATIGMDILVLYPAQSLGGSATLTYVVPPPPLVNTVGVQDILIPDEMLPLLQDLAEVVGTVRGRRLPESQDPLSRIRQTFGVLEDAASKAKVPLATN